MTATPITPVTARSMGTHLTRQDGWEKVTGAAAYAVEHAFDAPADADDGPSMARPLVVWLVTSTVSRGHVRRVDATDALAHPGVVAVVDHTSARRLARVDDVELAVLQDDAIAFRGQVVALVLAETIEAAREGARLVRVQQGDLASQVTMDDGEPYRPETVNAGHEPDSATGDVDAALAGAPVVVDATYTTPHEFNSPMEPHAVSAVWDGERLTMWDSTQAVHGVAGTIAPMLGLETSQVRVRAPYVGGGFGSKGMPHAPEMAAALAAFAADGRPVQLAVTRQQMFALTGYRTETSSRFRLGAEPDGRLLALEHEALSQTSRSKEFAEQTAASSRVVYAAPHRRTSHRVVPLDVAVPSWMRAPGEMPGMYAQEVAMDELAVACGVDPVQLRIRNEPDVDPDTGLPFNHRRLVECLERGAERFGWTDRDPEPGTRRDGPWRIGTGVAASTYPALFFGGNTARITALDEGRYAVAIGAVDIGTGARTVLTQIAADALGVEPGRIALAIGDTDLPHATVAGGSSGTSSWGTAVTLAAQQFRADHGDHPDPGVATTATSEGYPESSALSQHSFGAVFAEVRVHRRTGEVRVPRMLGVYSVGRVVNPTTGRSQLLGGLVMGLSAALHEDGYRDRRTGHVVTQDLATYHVASHADVGDLEAEWLDEEDLTASPMGSRGIGEIGIVGTAAAIANATFHATGTRVRSLPLTPDHFLG